MYFGVRGFSERSSIVRSWLSAGPVPNCVDVADAGAVSGTSVRALCTRTMNSAGVHRRTLFDECC